MKVFISIPMNGKSDEVIREHFDIVSTFVKTVYYDEDVEIIDSYVEENPPEYSNPGIWYLAKSIEVLSQADLLVITPDYDSYRGCKLEKLIAEDYGIDIITISELIRGTHYNR